MFDTLGGVIIHSLSLDPAYKSKKPVNTRGDTSEINTNETNAGIPFKSYHHPV